MSNFDKTTVDDNIIVLNKWLDSEVMKVAAVAAAPAAAAAATATIAVAAAATNTSDAAAVAASGAGHLQARAVRAAVTRGRQLGRQRTRLRTASWTLCSTRAALSTVAA